MPEKDPPPAISALPDGRLELRLENYMPVTASAAFWEPLTGWEREVVIRKLHAYTAYWCVINRLPLPFKTGRLALEGEEFVLDYGCPRGGVPPLRVPQAKVMP